MNPYPPTFSFYIPGDAAQIVLGVSGNPVVFSAGPEFSSDIAADGPDIIKNYIGEFIESTFQGNTSDKSFASDISSVLGKLDNCQRLHNREIDPVSDDVECQYGKQTCAVSLGKMVHSGACGFSNCPTSEDTSLASSKARLLDPENTRECCTSVEREKLGCKIESVKDIPMENLSQEWKLKCFVDHLYGGGN